MTDKTFDSATFYNIAFNDLVEAILVLDENFVLTYFNPSSSSIFNTSDSLLVGKNCCDQLSVYDLSGNNNLPLLLASLSEQDTHFNIPVLLKQVHFLLHIKVITSKEGARAGYLLKFFETTEKKQLGTTLIEGEKKYKGLFDNAQEGIFILNDSGIIVDANPSASVIYGQSSFEGMSIFKLFPHNSIAESDMFWKNFLKEGQITGFYKFILPNGNVNYIDFKAKSNYLPHFHLAVFTNVTEKKLVEKALLNSEANMKAVFDSSEQNIVLLDLSHRIIAANIKADDSTRKILGKSLAVGEDLLCYIINKDLFLSEFGEARKGTKTIVERNIKGVNGESNWIEFIYIPIKDGKGNVASICYTSSNINNRKKEELIRRESEQKFRSLAVNSPDIIYILDLINREINYFNRDIILGYKSDSLISSEAWVEIVYPEDYDRVIAHWHSFLKSRSKKAGSIEYRIRDASGVYEWVSSRHIIIEWDAKGVPAKALFNITIITDQIRAQEALKESEARLKALIENTSDLVWSVDNELNLTAVNTAFVEVVKNNYKKKIKVSDNLYTILPNLNKDGWLALHITALKGKKVTAEFSWLSKKKENIFYEISYNPIYDAENNVSGVSVFARDITQRQLNEATIVQTNFELDSFVYRASHDLRAPLRSILGLVNIINTQADEADKITYLRMIEKSTIKLDNFISDLINFSRNSRATVEIEVVNFNTIISECKETIGFMEGADNVDFSAKVKEDYPFYSDAKRISIFLNNFISNAIKYQDTNNKKKSYVDIQVNCTKSQAVIIIEDNGVGIRNEYHAKIFNMFFRASENSFGSGLGLYIAHQAVERLGGEIKVESKFSVGTTFTITLPNLENKKNRF